MKKLVLIIAVIMLIFSLSACADTNVKGSVVREDANGSAVLDIMPEKLNPMFNWRKDSHSWQSSMQILSRNCTPRFSRRRGAPNMQRADK